MTAGSFDLLLAKAGVAHLEDLFHGAALLALGESELLDRFRQGVHHPLVAHPRLARELHDGIVVHGIHSRVIEIRQAKAYVRWPRTV